MSPIQHNQFPIQATYPAYDHNSTMFCAQVAAPIPQLQYPFSNRSLSSPLPNQFQVQPDQQPDQQQRLQQLRELQLHAAMQQQQAVRHQQFISAYQQQELQHQQHQQQKLKEMQELQELKQHQQQQVQHQVQHQHQTHQSPIQEIQSSSSDKRIQSKADRRAEHNAIERARRESLNTKFQQLAHTLPNLQNDRRPSKGTIIERTLEFVKQTVHKEDRYRNEIRELRKANRQLLNQIASGSIVDEDEDDHSIAMSDFSDGLSCKSSTSSLPMSVFSSTPSSTIRHCSPNMNPVTDDYTNSILNTQTWGLINTYDTMYQKNMNINYEDNSDDDNSITDFDLNNVPLNQPYPSLISMPLTNFGNTPKSRMPSNNLPMSDYSMKFESSVIH